MLPSPREADALHRPVEFNDTAPILHPMGAARSGGIMHLAAVIAVLFASMAVMTPVLDVLVREPFGLGNRGVRDFMTIGSAAGLFFGIIAGWWSDRLGRRVPLILAALVGSGLLTALFPQIPSFKLLLGIRFMESIFSAFAVTLLFSRGLDLAPEGKRGATMALLSMALPVGYMLGPGLAALLGRDQIGVLFAIIGGALVLSGLTFIPQLKQPEQIVRDDDPRGMAGLAVLLRAPKLLLPMAFGFVDKFTFGTFAILTGLVIEDRFGLDSVKWTVIPLGLYWFFFFVLCPVAGRWCDRQSPVIPMLIGSLLYGLAMMSLGVVPLAGFIILMGVCGMLTAIMYVPTMVLVGKYAPADARASAMGIFNTVGTVGLIAGLVTSGTLSAREVASPYALSYLVAGGAEVLLVLCVAGVLFLQHRRSK